MKKIFASLALALGLLAATPAAAQIDLGIVGGLNLNSMSISQSAGSNLSSDNRCGWYIGPKVELTIPVIGLGFDASVQYSQRRLNAGDALTDKSTNYKSFEIPVNVSYGIGFSSIAKVFVATGPQFGFNIGDSNWTWNATDSYKFEKSYMTWNIGVGAKLLSHLEVMAGYNFGLGKLAKMAGSQPSSFKANCWQVQVGYFF